MDDWSKHEEVQYKNEEICGWINHYCKKAVNMGMLNIKFFKGCRWLYYVWDGIRNLENIKWKFVFWKKPEEDIMKINIDGSLNQKKGIAGIGGLFRNYEGACSVFFSSPVMAKNSIYTEVLACYFALRMASINPKRKLWMETDSTGLIRFLDKKVIIDIDWRLIHVWKKIIMLKSRLNIYFTHIYREANQPADLLAKRGAIRSSSLVSNVIDDELRVLIRRDLIQQPFIRNMCFALFDSFLCCNSLFF